MRIEVNAFVTSKSGCKIKDCQDSFDIDFVKNTIAVSDGVTQSMYSGFWSKILTSNFVKSPEDFFLKAEQKRLNPKYQDYYLARFNRRYSKLSTFQKRLVDNSKVKYAAATFVGLQVLKEEKKLLIDCLGDSVFFQYIKSSKTLRRCCSMDEDGEIAFDNSPEYFASNGEQNGTVKTRPIPLEESCVLIMTDAMSDWFNKIPSDSVESAIGELNSIDSHKRFFDFVEKLRYTGELKDDDTTMVVMNIIEDGCNDIYFVPKYVDDINALMLEETEDAFSALMTEKEQQKKTIMQLENDNISLNSRNALLKTENEDKQNEISNLNSKVSLLQSEKSKLETQLIDMKREYDLINQKCLIIEKEKLNLQSDWDELKKYKEAIFKLLS